MIKYIKINKTSDESHFKDKETYEYLENLKNLKGKMPSVIDVGGGASRIKEFTTHILDFQPEKLKDDNVFKFGGDMELSHTWIPIFDYVEKNGKFDFVICTHTLEDINSPHQVILNLFKIANAGLIAVPSKFIETKKWEGYYVPEPYMGYCHHRWIYTIKDKKLFGYPKMGSMEYIDFKFESSEKYYSIPRFQTGNIQSEMSFLWEKDFDMEFIAPYQFYDNFTHPQKKSKIIDFMERDDVDDLILSQP